MAQVAQNDWVKFAEFAPKIAHIMTERSLRDTVNKRKTNGASHFCKSPSGFLYLSLSRFYEWIEKEGKCE